MQVLHTSNAFPLHVPSWTMSLICLHVLLLYFVVSFCWFSFHCRQVLTSQICFLRIVGFLCLFVLDLLFSTSCVREDFVIGYTFCDSITVMETGLCQLQLWTFYLVFTTPFIPAKRFVLTQHGADWRAPQTPLLSGLFFSPSKTTDLLHSHVTSSWPSSNIVWCVFVILISGLELESRLITASNRYQLFIVCRSAPY